MKYIKASLLYSVYVIAALSIGFLFSMIPLYISRGFGATLFIQDIITVVSIDIAAMIVLFKVMYDNGYKRNTTYENKPWKELLISIGIIIPIYVLICLISDVVWIIGFFTLNTLNIISLIVGDYGNAYDIKLNTDNYYALLILASVIQIILIIPPMIAGFYYGYQKRGKVREKVGGEIHVN